jgi:DNA invertase Pin-like site-specific DNA recombinase
VPVGDPKLSRKDVRSIKRRIVAGESLRKIAGEYHVGYMTIYKIATGATWKTVKPRGRLIGNRDYSSTRTLPVAKCEAIALLKIRKRLSNSKIAAKLRVSESTVRRADAFGHAALGLRLHQHMVRGTLKAAQLRMELTDDEVEDLIRLSKKNVPDWIRKAVEDDVGVG